MFSSVLESGHPESRQEERIEHDISLCWANICTLKDWSWVCCGLGDSNPDGHDNADNKPEQCNGEPNAVQLLGGLASHISLSRIELRVGDQRQNKTHQSADSASATTKTGKDPETWDRVNLKIRDLYASFTNYKKYIKWSVHMTQPLGGDMLRCTWTQPSIWPTCCNWE